MAESKTSEGMTQLTDILEEISPHTQWEKNDSKANYIHDMREKLIEIFSALGLRDQLDCFKQVSAPNSPYVFYDSEVPFIKRLYTDYTKELVNVRKGEFSKISDAYTLSNTAASKATALSAVGASRSTVCCSTSVRWE